MAWSDLILSSKYSLQPGIFIAKMVADRVPFCHRVSSLNSNPDIDRVAKRIPICVEGLPGAFVYAFRERGREQDPQVRLCPGASGVQGNLFGSAKRGAADISQTISGIPIAGATVFYQPLLIERQPEGRKHVIRNGQVFEEREIVDTVCRVCRGKNRWQGSGFDHDDFLSRLDDKRWFDERSLGCRRTEGRRCGGR